MLIGLGLDQGGWLGGLLGVLVFVVLYAGFYCVVYLSLLWQPSFPRCYNCGKRERYTEKRRVQDGVLYRCDCGVEYLDQTNRSGKERFMEVMTDDTRRPYMVHSRFGRWRPDIEDK
jgi:hypothetical protein